jgi:prepilin-type N-terminal cleavage/methylation domain-containing protein
MNRKHHNFSPVPGKYGKGFTLLELLVTLIIVALVVYAAVSLLHNTDRHITLMRREMDKLSSIQHSMDRLLDDLTAAAAVQARFDISRESLSDGREACRLTIITEDASQKTRYVRRIDWVSVPRYEQQDLVLFRRERTSDQKLYAYYIPMCENLCTFEVEKLDAEGELAEKSGASLIEINARIFREGPRNPERVFTVSRTFCLDRFKL